MSTYDQIMAYYADDEEFQKRAQRGGNISSEKVTENYPTYYQ